MFLSLWTVFAIICTQLHLSFTDNNNNGATRHPGHLKPLASHQPKTEIEELFEFPSPKDFFEKYVQERQPFLLKKGAINQPAFKLWNDEYMTSFPKAAEELVQVEPNKKEVRNATGFTVPLQEFISRYRKDAIYMVNQVPSFLQKDIIMPSPLRCNSTRALMLDHITWMSSGGTKSVLHYDNLDNINCLFRGSKELLMVPPKYEHKVPMDRGAFSSLDVDKVDFEKYPSMKDVEFVHCKMEEGDCLFIPFEWPHQVNSVANADNQNIAVNVWFEHDPNHKLEGCEDLPAEKTSIDNWQFKGIESLFAEAETNQMSSYIEVFQYLLSLSKSPRLSVKEFIKLILKTDGLFMDESVKQVKPNLKIIEISNELFSGLDFNEDRYFDEKDLTVLENNDKVDKNMAQWLDQQFIALRDALLEALPGNHDSNALEDLEEDESLGEEDEDLRDEL